jgi:multiple sugar transport system substrate-binding protein
MFRLKNYRHVLLLSLFVFALVGFSPVLAQDTVTLQVWDFGGVEFEYVDSVVIPAFEAQYPNIQIEHLGIPEGEYNLKLETAIAGRQAPDIALQSYSYRLWKAGHVISLDDFFARDGFTPADFYPIFQSWNMLDGKVYTMPVTMNLWGMLINADLFEAAGLPVPTSTDVITYDQWLEYARAINKPSDDLTQRVWGSVQFTPNWNAMNNYMSDPYILGADGHDCFNSAQTADWLHTWDVMATANAEGLTTDSNAALLGDTAFDDLFKLGQVGMIYGTESNVTDARNSGINVVFMGQPVVTSGWMGNVGAWATGYGIMAQSQHPEEAWTFLKWLGTDGALLIGNSAADVVSNVDTNSSPPTYRPLAQEWAGDDEFRNQVLQLQENVAAPPFSPDIWTSVDPFYRAWQQITQEGVPVTDAVAAAADECQLITEDLWDTWDSLTS